MSGTPPTPLQQVMAAARDVARRRLCAAVPHLLRLVPGDGVLFNRVAALYGARVRVMVAWPGTVELFDQETGEPIREIEAADLIDFPDVANYLARAMQRKDGTPKPLLEACYRDRHGKRKRATLQADGVVRVYESGAAKVLVAASEPGEPSTLCASFLPLKPEDLAPRLT